MKKDDVMNLATSANIAMSKMVILINKMDRHSWQEQVFNDIVDTSIPSLIRKKCIIIPTSIQSPFNLYTNQPQVPECSWYKGPSLMEGILQCFKSKIARQLPLKLARECPLVLLIERIYKSHSSGKIVVASGYVMRGVLVKDNYITFLGVGGGADKHLRVKVIGIQIQAIDVNLASVGAWVGVKLEVSDPTHAKSITSGTVAAEEETLQPCPKIVTKFNAQCVTLGGSGRRVIQGGSSTAMMYWGTSNIEVKVKVTGTVEKGKTKPLSSTMPVQCTNGLVFMAEISPARQSRVKHCVLEPFQVRVGDVRKATPLGCFLLRDNGKTFAIGAVRSLK
eukprot:TRINITY_DN10032_c0_g4_i1.p1 TRINITY_DN10032_c0_g4~~TRINITY_DN10032_c0_g4_i1.p1  ORF type:complete len:364 (-),score=39.25 TRINITY_DN10032_c0_g4_i1:3-1007(-)